MNDWHQGSTALIHTYITDHQRHFSNRSPPALGHSPSNPLWVLFLISTPLPLPQPTVVSAFSCLMKLFFTTLYSPTSATEHSWWDRSTNLPSARFYYKHWTFGPGLYLKHTFREVGRAGESSDCWVEWIYEHKQLFKPRLFTDNLLTIQLFILRQRPSPSHKQMKSNLISLVIVKDLHPHYTIKLNIPILLSNFVT